MDEGSLDELIRALPNVDLDAGNTRQVIDMLDTERGNFEEAGEAATVSTLSMVRAMLAHCLDQGDTAEKAFASTCGALILLGMSVQRQG